MIIVIGIIPPVSVVVQAITAQRTKISVADTTSIHVVSISRVVVSSI